MMRQKYLPPHRHFGIRYSLFVITLALACDRSSSSRTPSSQAASDNSVVVYCSVDTAFAEPILAEFEKRSGLRVYKVFDTEAGKTTGLVNKLMAEKAAPRADVWWSGEIFGTIQLADAGILESYKPPTANDIPERYRDPAGRWTAFGLRGRVLAFDPTRTKKGELPRRWCDLADPRYKGRFRMADPRFGTTRGHMAVLLSLWGEPAMRDFYRKLRANDCVLTDGNSQSVLHVSRGLADLGATDTDDVIVAQAQGVSIDRIYPDLDAPSGKKSVPGTLWMPCSAALVHDAPHSAEGRRLVDYLVGSEIEEQLYGSDSRNIPVRKELRARLHISPTGEAAVDFAAAARLLPLSDKLVSEELLK